MGGDPSVKTERRSRHRRRRMRSDQHRPLVHSHRWHRQRPLAEPAIRRLGVDPLPTGPLSQVHAAVPSPEQLYDQYQSQYDKQPTTPGVCTRCSGTGRLEPRSSLPWRPPSGEPGSRAAAIRREWWEAPCSCTHRTASAAANWPQSRPGSGAPEPPTRLVRPATGPPFRSCWPCVTAEVRRAHEQFLPCHGRGHYACDCRFLRSSSLLRAGSEVARRLIA